MAAGKSTRGRPRGRATQASQAAHTNTDNLPEGQGRGRGRSRGRGRGRGKVRGTGRGHTNTTSPTLQELSSSSSEGDKEQEKEQLDPTTSGASKSSRQLRQRSGSVHYDESPSQREGALAEDDSAEWEVAAPDF